MCFPFYCFPFYRSSLYHIVYDLSSLCSSKSYFLALIGNTSKAPGIDYSDLLLASEFPQQTQKQFVSRGYHAATKRAREAGLKDSEVRTFAQTVYAVAKVAYVEYWA